jgi:tetratricopeptide (TPR) repeat protein
MSKALEEGRHAVELNPKNVGHRHNLALYADYAGEFDSAAKEASSVLSMNPKDVHGLLAMAMAQVGQDRPQEAAASYRQMQGISAFGASKAAIGLADIHLYQGTVSEAIPILQRGVTADLASKDEASAATKLSVLAFALLLSGSRAQALREADRAVALDPEESVSFSAGRVYLEAGEIAKALKLASTLASRIEPEPQIYGKLLEGEVKLKTGDVRQALSAFEAAQKIADTWLGHFDLGRAYLTAGKFTEADSEFETCLKRRGEASAVFLDDVPTYHLLPPVYYYLGRAQEGLNSPAAAESYKTFLALRNNAEKDPLVLDARRRVGSH